MQFSLVSMFKLVQLITKSYSGTMAEVSIIYWITCQVWARFETWSAMQKEIAGLGRSPCLSQKILFLTQSRYQTWTSLALNTCLSNGFDSFSNCVISINIYKHNCKSLNVEFHIFFQKYMTKQYWKHIFSKFLRYFEFAYF